MTHNLNALTAVVGIAFSGSTSGYTLGGNALSLASGSISNANTSGTNTLTINLVLATNQTFVGNTGAMVLNGGLDFGNHQLGINWPAVNGSVAPWKFNGIISGAGGITATGHDTSAGLIIGGNNTFSGPVTLVSGSTQLDHANALGVADNTSANGTSVGGNATLVMGDAITIGSEALTLASGMGEGGGGMIQHLGTTTNTWVGSIQLPGNGTTYFKDSNNFHILALNGAITGTGGLDFGNSPQTAYILDNPNNAFGGNLVTHAPFGASVRLTSNNVIPDTAEVILNGVSTFVLNGNTETIAALRCTATDEVLLGFGSKLKVGGNNANTACAGVISGAFNSGLVTSLTKVGSGILTLSAINTFTGDVDVQGGGLEVTGKLIADPAAGIFVAGTQNATLFGTGTVGNVIAAGTIHGGTSDTPGTLTTDSLTIFGAGVLSARLDSAVAYDRVKAANVAISSNATIAIVLGFAPTAGDSFTLIENLGVASVQGQFDGLSEGATLNVNGTPFVLSYSGGDGNDVTVTAGSPPLPPSVVYAPPTGTAPILSATGSGSIAATATNFSALSSVTISNCAVSPSSPAFPANAFTVVNPTFAAPNGSIGIACAPQATSIAGTLSCNEIMNIGPTVRSWPITCPAEVAGVGVAPTAALGASSVGLIDGIGSVDVNVLTSGIAVGSLDLNCSIPPGAANFQITSGGQRLIDAPATLGANAPAIGLSCVEQSTTQMAMLSCAQTANPGPNPADLTAIVTCRGAAQPPVVPSVQLPTLSQSTLILLSLLMLMIGAYVQRKQKSGRKRL